MALGRGLGELLGEVESAYENSTRSNRSGILGCGYCFIFKLARFKKKANTLQS